MDDEHATNVAVEELLLRCLLGSPSLPCALRLSRLDTPFGAGSLLAAFRSTVASASPEAGKDGGAGPVRSDGGDRAVDDRTDTDEHDDDDDDVKEVDAVAEEEVGGGGGGGGRGSDCCFRIPSVTSVVAAAATAAAAAAAFVVPPPSVPLPPLDGAPLMRDDGGVTSTVTCGLLSPGPAV